MATNTKLFANGEQLNPETIASQVKHGATDVASEIDTLQGKVGTLEAEVQELGRVSDSVRLLSLWNGSEWDVAFEKWDEKYADFDSYRLCVMSKRGKCPTSKTGNRAYKWRVPMLYELTPHPNDPQRPMQSIAPTAVIPQQRINVAKNDGFGGHFLSTNFTPLDICMNPRERASGDIVKYKIGYRVTGYVGVALFKHTGKGQFGWERISNIAGLRTTLGNKTTNEKVVRTAFHEI